MKTKTPTKCKYCNGTRRIYENGYELCQKCNGTGIEPTTHLETSMEERFNKKVNELRNANFKTEKPVDFGYRYTNAVSDEIYSATDWGNVKKFIRKEIQLAVSKAEKRIIEKFEKYVAFAKTDINGDKVINEKDFDKALKKLLTNSQEK